MKLKNSPTQALTFKKKHFYIKRDDLLDDNFSGNKARKFAYFLEKDFPYITKLISHGSNQSNAMYSLSVLCKLKGWKFEYYTNHIPSHLELNPSGNYKGALDNDMNIIIEDFDRLKLEENNNTLIVSEGGAIREAQHGLQTLASEIKEWKKENKLNNLKIFLPSGTGTTALFLQKFLEDEVLTCACVGDEDYLQKQFYQLENDNTNHPTILSRSKKYHFGKLYKENYLTWIELLHETKIEFDLLYDPVGWQTLFHNIEYITDNTILYIHQGGLKGNETMKLRYERKFIV